MNTLLSLVTIFLFAISALSVSTAQAGHATGNGGDHVRATFMLMGERVASYLEETTEGAATLAKHKLDLTALKSALQAAKIDVVEGGLLDNGGVPVDATGAVGKITLNKTRWMEHFEKNRDVYYLVLHEMLRAIGVNDDDYAISRDVRPFPASRRAVTRVSSIYPLVGEDEIASWIEKEKISLFGNGCSLGQLGTTADFDAERNTLELSFDSFEITPGTGGTFARKHCSLAIPLTVPPGRRLVVTQSDVSAKFELDALSSLKVTSEVFLTGTRATTYVKEAPPATTARKGRVLDRRTNVLVTPCGSATTLRMSSSVFLQRAAPLAASAASLDRITLSFRSEACP